jgi:hypothetical protein
MARKPTAAQEDKSLLISTLHYRKVVGLMGLFLTPVLYLFAGCFIPDSISSYYYQASSTIFVGTMCSIGLFLCCYEGYDLGDHVGSFIAGMAAVMVGLCPTAPDPPTMPTPHQLFMGDIHLASATVFFLAITYLCWFQFVQSDKSLKNQTPQKRIRNGVYRFCGLIMLVGLLGVEANHVWGDAFKAVFTVVKPVWFFETIAIVAFGFAWLVKGEGLIWDEGRDWWSGKLTKPKK